MPCGVGMLLDEGLVMVSDSRAHAGVDQVASFRKMHVFEVGDERCLVLLSAGNLAVAQSVLSLPGEGVGEGPDAPTITGVASMFEAARWSGSARPGSGIQPGADTRLTESTEWLA